jgi:hypothetical protein
MPFLSLLSVIDECTENDIIEHYKNLKEHIRSYASVEFKSYFRISVQRKKAYWKIIESMETFVL